MTCCNFMKCFCQFACLIALLFICVFFVNNSAANESAAKKNVEKDGKTLVLATTQWCPYTCGDENFKYGVIGTYITALLAQQNIKAKIQYYPWSRAVKLAQEGKVDGLLTATYEEAPALIFTSSPVSHYQMCFFTNKNNQWQFQQPMSLGDNSLLVIQSYGYGEPLDTFIHDNRDVMSISGLNATQRLIDFLVKERADIIVEDDVVINWMASKNNVDFTQFRNAGCMAKNPFYFALSPSKKHQVVIDKLNITLSQLENKAYLESLFLSLNDSVNQ
ncbi:hypothetical protein [Thalassotalea sp. PLHSN55]|uniref:hypothetical protein n=1 Tax=Thalassotalea sp. PLHSN55 TaxID=3435888 RepID=UPI003F841EC9